MTERNFPSYLDIPANKILPMTKSETEDFFRLFMTERDWGSKKQMQLDMLNDFVSRFRFARDFIRRLQAVGVYDKVSPFLIVFLGTTISSPADGTLWAYTLHKATKGSEQVLTIGGWAKLFPHGLPGEDQKLACWNAQKSADGEYGNSLDAPDVYGLSRMNPVEFPLTRVA